jgi:hypothetical protein
MAEKAPMIGVVVSPSLLQRLKAWQARERRKSFSEFCSLLLEFSANELDARGSLAGLLSAQDRIPSATSALARAQAEKGKNVYGSQHQRRRSKAS